MNRAALIVAVLSAALLVRVGTAPAGDGVPTAEASTAAVAAVLDDFHAAAAAADGPRYFGHFAPEGVFIGTDATERWTLEEFKAFAKPYFDKGKGWAYTPTSRHVQASPGGDVAWFDESLESAAYGDCRGTGVLLRIEGAWKIAQYNLTIPIPNALAADFVAKIRAAAQAPPAGTPAATETLVYVVRHAERESGPKESDPPLKEKGQKRAQALARTLRSVSLKAIYTTDTRRTRETVARVAAASSLEPVVYDAKEPESLASILRAAPLGQGFLVCGHANTIPALLERLGVKEAVTVPEDENDGLYVVALSPGHPTRLLRLHYGSD